MISAMIVCLVAAGCGSGNTPPVGQVGHVSGNFGGVVSDEPRASLIGRDILSSGGNAVDAVVAMYFALSVTYPDAATLGGEGVCIVHRSNREGGVEAIEFQPLLIRRDGKTVAIPGGVRGMFALHARHGRLAWARLVQPAERLARFGNPVSRAFARQLAAVPATAYASPAAREIFTVDGKAVGEGQILEQVQLASVLASIRIRGAGDFYTGELAKRFAAGLSDTAGVPVTVADVRAYRPRWLKTMSVNVGNHELHVPEGPKSEDFITLWDQIADGGAAAPAPDDAANSNPSGDSAGFAAIDIGSGAAACTVGAHGALRDARIIGDTGILAAGTRPTAGLYPGQPMVLVNVPRKDALGAATGSGNVAGEARAVRGVVSVFDTSSEEPMKGIDAPALPGARTNIIFCPTGIEADPDLCRFAVEPGAHGLAAGAGL